MLLSRCWSEFKKKKKNKLVLSQGSLLLKTGNYLLCSSFCSYNLHEFKSALATGLFTLFWEQLYHWLFCPLLSVTCDTATCVTDAPVSLPIGQSSQRHLEGLHSHILCSLMFSLWWVPQLLLAFILSARFLPNSLPVRSPQLNLGSLIEITHV